MRHSLEQGSQDGHAEVLSVDDATVQEPESTFVTKEVDEIHQSTLKPGINTPHHDPTKHSLQDLFSYTLKTKKQWGLYTLQWPTHSTATVGGNCEVQ